MKKKKILLWAILIVVVLAIARFGISSWRKYQTWTSHQAYFEQSPENRIIEAWMTPSFIIRHYNIKLEAINPSFWEKRKPVSDLCKSRRIDCDVLLKKINTQIAR